MIGTVLIQWGNVIENIKMFTQVVNCFIVCHQIVEHNYNYNKMNLAIFIAIAFLAVAAYG